MEITNLGKADGLPPVDWAAVAGKLDAGSAPAPDAVNSRTTWLSTINEDGSPHVTAVGALWLDGTFWFQTQCRVEERVRAGGLCPSPEVGARPVSVTDCDPWRVLRDVRHGRGRWLGGRAGAGLVALITIWER